MLNLNSRSFGEDTSRCGLDEVKPPIVWCEGLRRARREAFREYGDASRTREMWWSAEVGGAGVDRGAENEASHRVIDDDESLMERKGRGGREEVDNA